MNGNLGHISLHTFLRHKRCVIEYLVALDECIAEKPGSYAFHLLEVQPAGEQVLDRCIDTFTFPKGAANDVLDSLFGGPAHVVCNTGPETHLHDKIKIATDRHIDGKILNDRIGKRTGSCQFELGGSETGIDRKHIYCPDLLDRYVQKVLYLAPDPFSPRVANVILQSYFYSMGHYQSFSISTVLVGYGICTPFS